MVKVINPKVINPFDFSAKRCVYGKKDYAGPPTADEVYIYVMNSCRHVLDAVVAFVHQIPDIGEEVIYIKDAKRVSITWPAKVITKAEYETWHEFDKA